MSEKSVKFQQDIMAKITQTVIDGIESGTAPWLKPWDTRNNSASPENLATHKSYRGLNRLYLSMLGSQVGCDYWLGAKQGMKLGGVPLKNTGIYILAPMTKRVGEHEDGSAKYIILGFRIVKVHNALAGFSGLADKIPKTEELSEPRQLDLTMLNDFFATRGADIRHGGDHAYYNPGMDFVQVPDLDQFHSEAGYYGTVLHELTHWTGHKSRLDRLAEKSKRGYAFEELIAELGCYYASVRLDCPNEAENHTSYLETWLKALKSDTRYLWDAASKAEKAADWLIDEAHKVTDKKEVKQAA